MKKALLVTAALTALALATGSVTSGSSELTGPAKINLSTRQIAMNYNDTGSPGRGPGDVVVIRELLYNKGIRRAPIGHSEMVCWYTGRRWQQCSGTYFLPRGKLVVAGSLRYREFFKLAVIGGTDLYDNVNGSVSATMYSRNPRRSILIFRLTI